jgi:hypothetical protein
MSPSAATTYRRLTPLVGALVLLLLAASGVLPGAVDALAYLLPAVLLGLVLVARLYPGERALIALIERRRSRRPGTKLSSFAATGRRRAMVPRGGLLLACALAVRPPPMLRVAPS